MESRWHHLRQGFSGGFILNWKELPKFRKIVFLVGILCFFIGVVLTALKLMHVIAGIEWLNDILDCGFWLSIGVVFWGKDYFFSIVSFVLCGLNAIGFFL